MRQIVFATNNAHKLEELRQIMGKQFEVLSLADINCHEDIPEDQPTIEGNARQKAEYIREHYGYDCFSDDTGLEIDALGGEPGVHSARYGGVAHDSDGRCAHGATHGPLPHCHLPAHGRRGTFVRG